MFELLAPFFEFEKDTLKSKHGFGEYKLGRAPFSLEREGEVIFSTEDEDEFKKVVIFRVFEDILQKLKTRYVFLGASAVLLGGEAKIFVGKTMSGKSTEVDKLCSDGGIYLGDDPVLIDLGKVCVAFPKPVRLRKSTGEEFTLPPHAEPFSRHRAGSVKLLDLKAKEKSILFLILLRRTVNLSVIGKVGFTILAELLA